MTVAAFARTAGRRLARGARRAHPAGAAGALAALVALLTLPSVDSHLFDGLPLDSPFEAAALVPLALLLAAERPRRALLATLSSWGGARGVTAVLCLAAAGIVTKILLAATGTPAGFAACYSSPLAAPPAGPCERLYAAPFSGGRTSRDDEVIDFRRGRWNLSFFNALRFYSDAALGQPDREHMPLAATWTGIVDEPPGEVRVSYVGEGTLAVGDVVTTLAASYERPAEVVVRLAGGRHPFRLTYRFDDGYRIGDSRQGPYAAIAVRVVRGGRPAAPLRAAPPPLLQRVAGRAVDVLVVLLLVPLVVRIVARLRPVLGPFAVALAVLAAGALLRGHQGSVLGLLVFFAWSLRARGRTSLVAAYLLALCAAATACFDLFPSIDHVAIRNASDDWFTYEAFARDILEQWSWRAGEPVFYYQPLFRYVRFAERLLFGDGDVLVVAAALSLLFVSPFVLWRSLVGRPRARSAVLVPAVIVGLLVLLVQQHMVTSWVRLGASEYPTWIAWMSGAALLYGRPARPVLGAVLLAGAAATRTNQLPGVLLFTVLAPCLAWRAAPASRWSRAAVSFAAVLSLPLVHNLAYGGRFVPFTTSSRIAENLVLPPAVLLGTLEAPEVRARVWDQVRALIIVGAPSAPPAFRWLMYGLFAAWASSVVLLWRDRAHRAARAALLCVPLLLLGVHVFYQVWVYYPRHIIAGYLAFGITALLVHGRSRARGMLGGMSMSVNAGPSEPTDTATPARPDDAADGGPGPTSRRVFLATASSAVVAAVAVPAAAQPVIGAVTKETLTCGEDLTGVPFSDAERDLMLRAVNANREHYEALRRVPLGPQVEPAIAFRVPAAAAAGRPPATRGSGVRLGSAVPASPPVDDDLAFASVVELAALLRERRVSATELARLCLDRLDRHGPRLECVITPTRELALEQAAAADREIAAGRYRGPLHGVPYGLKDLVATRGIRTTWGAKPYEHQVFDYDATVYERLREAGAVLVAKLTSGELAVGDRWFGGKTRNPWNLERGSSGSSAGPASATAAGLVPFAIGTETNGSIMSPASTCGVTGLRPTYGRVSRHGVMALRWTMDKVGVIARTAADCALALDAVYGPDGLDETVADVAFAWEPAATLDGLRVGVVETELGGADPEASPDERLARAHREPLLRAAIEVLRQAGARLAPVTLPDLPARAMYAVCNAEAGAAFDDLVRSGAVATLAEQGPNGRANQLRWARFVPAVEYLRAQRIRSLLVRQVDALFSRFDVLVSPADSASVTMTNFTGHPAVTVNAGFVSGLPIGLMVTGRYFDEATLATVAHLFQQRTDWHRARPPIDAASHGAA